MGPFLSLPSFTSTGSDLNPNLDGRSSVVCESKRNPYLVPLRPKRGSFLVRGVAKDKIFE